MFRILLLSALRAVAAVAHVVALLVVELVTAMLVYTYLNLYHVQTFGSLVRLAKNVLDTMVAQLEYWFPVTANAAYATLVGELGPKSILLLLIGLLSGVFVRFVARMVTGLVTRARPARPATETA